MSENNLNKLVNAARSIVSSRFALEAASAGWRYAVHLERSFILSDELRGQLAPAASNQSGLSAETIRFKRPSDILAELQNLSDKAELMKAIENVCQSPTSAILSDDFANLAPQMIDAEIRKMFHQNQINIVILGGGIVGLALANALKIQYGAEISILIIETRVSAPHLKKPYTRNWLTNIVTKPWTHIFDPQVFNIAQKLGQTGYAGLPINALETMFLLSNRTLGVKFLFQQEYSLDFLASAPVNIVFDATGGRLAYNRASEQTSEALKIQLDNYQGASLGKGFANFGITNHRACEEVELIGHATNIGTRLVFDGSPITIPMTKVTNLPFRLYDQILETIHKNNDDSKFYIWPGTLQPEVNSLLLLVNLEVSGWNYLSANVKFPISLLEFLTQHGDEFNDADPRYRTILSMIADNLDEWDAPELEAPFLFEPRIRFPAETTNAIGNIPFIPVGDSLFIGHPKVGNGVGQHLNMISLLMQQVQA